MNEHDRAAWRVAYVAVWAVTTGGIYMLLVGTGLHPDKASLLLAIIGLCLGCVLAEAAP